MRRAAVVVGVLCLLAASQHAAGVAEPADSGPRLVRDINPSFESGNPSHLIDVGGTLFFFADDGTAAGLWRSDGTWANTRRLKALKAGATDPGEQSSRRVAALDNRLLFAADDGLHGHELWRSDGTAGGTRLVKDIRVTGSAISEYKSPELTIVNGTLYFAADDGTHGVELWRSDGTGAGTAMVRDIAPLGSSSSPSKLVDVGGTLFFTASDGANGTELWKSDGTEAGTVLVKDVRPGPAASLPWNLTSVGGVALFSADNGLNGRELWRSDGSAAGTQLVKDINPVGSGMPPWGVPEIVAVGSVAYFGANDGARGEELWRSDGSAEGTRLVKDIRLEPAPLSSPENVTSSFPNQLTNVAGTLFFSANDGVHGDELWKSDGTEAGTILLDDIYPGPSELQHSSYPGGFTAVGERLYFRAADSSESFLNYDWELWTSNGVPGGARLVKDIDPLDSSYPNQLTPVGQLLFFSANDGLHGEELWVTGVGAGN